MFTVDQFHSCKRKEGVHGNRVAKKVRAIGKGQACKEGTNEKGKAQEKRADGAS